MPFRTYEERQLDAKAAAIASNEVAKRDREERHTTFLARKNGPARFVKGDAISRAHMMELDIIPILDTSRPRGEEDFHTLCDCYDDADADLVLAALNGV